ncbi:MAG: ParA family protein [Planctomycetes bacterium]|nr:ParA family protein [Planctomycetota bacterium]
MRQPSSAQTTAPVIVVGNNKGGIGRTVTAVNLAATLALSGRRTLLVDLDPKGDATAALGLARDGTWRGIESIEHPETFLASCVSAPSTDNLDVWTGGPALEELQAELWRETDPRVHLLDHGLSGARQRYRSIVVDAPPALDPLGCNALAAANVLLIPLSGAAFSVAALEETIGMARELCQRSLKILGVRLGIRDGVDEVGVALPGSSGTLDCSIAYDAETLLEATERGLPVFEYAPTSRVARSFVELGREVIRKVLEAA